MNSSGYFSCTLGGAALVAIFVLTRWRAAAPRCNGDLHGDFHAGKFNGRSWDFYGD
jgi:hypothetical protein